MLIRQTAGFVIFGCFAVSMALASENGTASLSEYEPPLTPDLAERIRSADPSEGQKIFERRCWNCHDHKKAGGHGKGPHLWNVVGRQAGTIPGFSFSEAMRSSGHTWSYATLDYYLTRTERAVPGLAMEFRGIRKDEERAQIIAFLRARHDNPPPLPEDAPATQN